MQPLLLTNAVLATMRPGHPPYGLVEAGAVAIADGVIQWCGDASKIPADYSSWQLRDLEGHVVTPALIDCHTHIVFGGNRAKEFEMRLQGATYEEVARAGGGIVSTVKATRNTSEDDLVEQALPRVDALIAEGVSAIEIKSGYGLDIKTETRMLRAARRIAEQRAIRVHTSFLGAHALPAEYVGRADAYIDEICVPALDQIAGEKLADSVDGFCEGIGFSPAQIERVFVKAQDLGLAIRLHAEQLSNLNGAALAARYGALSADHLEFIDETGVKAMAASKTVAVLLPGAFYTLRETQLPPIDLFRQNNVSMAIATDCNPGSSPLASILLTMNMASTLFRMTPEEALAGATREATKALGFVDSGLIDVGMRADLAIWNITHPSELAYRIGFNPLRERIFAGNVA